MVKGLIYFRAFFACLFRCDRRKKNSFLPFSLTGSLLQQTSESSVSYRCEEIHPRSICPSTSRTASGQGTWGIAQNASVGMTMSGYDTANLHYARPKEAFLNHVGLAILSTVELDHGTLISSKFTNFLLPGVVKGHLKSCTFSRSSFSS